MSVNQPSGDRLRPDLNVLVGMFYFDPAEVARFEPVDASDVPEPFHMLLVHDAHMTVTVEKFYESPVDVVVLEKSATGSQYARQILLARRSDGKVVQWGIMRVSFSHLPDDVRALVESESQPLGRILIEHNVHRQVRLASLWRVTPGTGLARHLGKDVVYGRTAIIEVEGEPAVELLEVVAAP